jgi:hypothetical protein
MSEAFGPGAHQAEFTLAELRALLSGVPGATLAGQIQTLLRDQARLDWLVRYPHALIPPDACDGSWEVQDAECESVARAVTLRNALDIAMLAHAVETNRA